MDIAAAGGIIFDDQRRLLLIRRGRPPGAGLWSVPGGKCRPDEPTAVACVREVFEETGLRVRVLSHAGQVVRAASGNDRFVIDDYLCGRESPGRLTAGDDADAVGWFSASDLSRLEVVPLLSETLARWGLLPD